ncbi:MAG: hypothetical protein D6693_05270 [Planctomycetota bacterium]|nr:MAG: hypothetical protein D6693_05270 [Planctomycetota bacterium]
MNQTQTSTGDSSAPASAALAAGRIAEIGDGSVVLAIPGTDYRLRLGLAAGARAPAVGAKALGRIRLVARRIDPAPSGGRYIEPVEGPPRRVQGRVRAIDEVNNEIVVHAGVPVCARVGDARQRAGQFAPDQIVSFDVERGAVFEPA